MDFQLHAHVFFFIFYLAAVFDVDFIIADRLAYLMQIYLFCNYFYFYSNSKLSKDSSVLIKFIDILQSHFY